MPTVSSQLLLNTDVLRVRTSHGAVPDDILLGDYKGENNKLDYD